MLNWIANSLFPKRFSRPSQRICSVALICLAAACTPLQGPPVVPDDGFVVNGRISVRSEDDGFSGNFRWQHSAAGFDIELWGPMGQGRSRLVGSDDSVTLYAADGGVYLEPDTETAMRRWLGVAVPVAALTHWVKGLAAPDDPIDARTVDENGDLTSLSQGAWHLDFDRYAPQPDGRRLPGRVVAEMGAVRVTLLPRQWWFGSGTP